MKKIGLVKEMEPGVPVFWDRTAAGDLAADLRIAREKAFEALVIEQRGITEACANAVKPVSKSVPGQ